MIDDELHYLLLIGFNYSSHMITSEALKIGLMPGQPKILEFLLEHNGTTQKKIGLGCILDKSTVTSLLSRMFKQQQIVRKCDAQDRRIMHIFLTDKGRQLAISVKAICEKVDEKAWNNISNEEKQEVIHIFNKIIKNFKEQEVI